MKYNIGDVVYYLRCYNTNVRARFDGCKDAIEPTPFYDSLVPRVGYVIGYRNIIMRNYRFRPGNDYDMESYSTGKRECCLLVTLAMNRAPCYVRMTDVVKHIPRSDGLQPI